jgi:cytochrome oxidase Cu insertion factor (SCO1/SenC/PrrC family)
VSAKKKKKVSRKQLQAEKKQRAARRRNWLLGVGIGVALLVGYFIVVSGGGIKPPITEGLSTDEIAALPAAPVIGANAPDFTILDVEDNSFTLSEALGNPTALMFFHTW